MADEQKKPEQSEGVRFLYFSFPMLLASALVMLDAWLGLSVPEDVMKATLIAILGPDAGVKMVRHWKSAKKHEATSKSNGGV